MTVGQRPPDPPTGAPAPTTGEASLIEMRGINVASICIGCESANSNT